MKQTQIWLAGDRRTYDVVYPENLYPHQIEMNKRIMESTMTWNIGDSTIRWPIDFDNGTRHNEATSLFVYRLNTYGNAMLSPFTYFYKSWPRMPIIFDVWGYLMIRLELLWDPKTHLSSAYKPPRSEIDITSDKAKRLLRSLIPSYVSEHNVLVIRETLPHSRIEGFSNSILVEKDMLLVHYQQQVDTDKLRKQRDVFLKSQQYFSQPRNLNYWDYIDEVIPKPEPTNLYKKYLDWTVKGKT